MALWKCSKCGTTKESRCKPKKCPSCGEADTMIKEETQGNAKGTKGCSSKKTCKKKSS
ncbi:MAG: RCKP-type rubredoxin-like domain-containing protein [Caldimicrobium sp.]|jgi:ABC-type ATPase with predicted acetyltransferase domain